MVSVSPTIQLNTLLEGHWKPASIVGMLQIFRRQNEAEVHKSSTPCKIYGFKMTKTGMGLMGCGGGENFEHAYIHLLQLWRFT